MRGDRALLESLSAFAAAGSGCSAAAEDVNGDSAADTLAYALPPRGAPRGAPRGEPRGEPQREPRKRGGAGTSDGVGDGGGWHRSRADSSEIPNDVCEIDVVGADLSPRDFLLRFLAVGRPVLVRGAADAWPLVTVSPTVLRCSL